MLMVRIVERGKEVTKFQRQREKRFTVTWVQDLVRGLQFRVS